MTAQPIFEHEVSFSPDRAAEVLRSLPASAGVVALFGPQTTDRPHILKAANLRRRLQRLLEPADGQTKRLNLRDRIARIAWSQTGSELESLLLLHRAMSAIFGAEESRRKLRLSTPYTIRFAAENRFPRIYVTNHLRRRSLDTTFGPFASRFAAERYCEAVEELFTIRRCYLELHPAPDDPGCIYGEIKKCMAPCQARCSDEAYTLEAQAALNFLVSRGQSLTDQVERERDRASEDMRFEDAAAAHTRAQKVKATVALTDPLVHPLSELRTLLLTPAGEGLQAVKVFLFAGGRMRGPELLSVQGVRPEREQAAVGSSLFAQPLMLAAVPETGSDRSSPDLASPEERLLATLTRLEDGSQAEDMATLGDHLALLRRWYYRPEKQRVGAIFFRERDLWPLRKVLRAAAKLALPPEPADLHPAPTEEARAVADPQVQP